MNDAEDRVECLVCEASVNPDSGLDWCKKCRERYPYPLLKAMTNNWTFRVMLTSGELITFNEATIVGDWVTLHDPKWHGLMGDPDPTPGDGFVNYSRGLTVQINQILWCVDEAS